MTCNDCNDGRARGNNFLLTQSSPGGSTGVGSFRPGKLMYNLHTAIIIYYYDDGRDNNNSENENGPRLMTIGPRCFGCPVEDITVLHCGG